jgi:endogenous inhibitor of DNA gyrase (YacG/DUF329 family)
MDVIDQVQQPQRVVVGHCPRCGMVVVVLNNRGVWPYIECRCGAHGDMDWLVNKHRIEDGFVINNGVARQVRP